VIKAITSDVNYICSFKNQLWEKNVSLLRLGYGVHNAILTTK